MIGIQNDKGRSPDSSGRPYGGVLPSSSVHPLEGRKGRWYIQPKGDAPMDVEFGNRTLERCFEREAEAIREWGPEVGHRYVQRIKAILGATSFDVLFLVQSLHLHPLQGDRAGDGRMVPYACGPLATGHRAQR